MCIGHFRNHIRIIREMEREAGVRGKSHIPIIHLRYTLLAATVIL
jgi:hypothetical protein